jgi:hypothetical protein
MSIDLVSPTPFRHDGAAGEQDIADFVSEYASGLSNAAQDYRSYEDHAESVTAYLLLPEYFRDRMQHSARLQEKYAYIRDHHFDGVEFSNPALLQHGSPFVLPGGSLAAFYRDNEIARFDVDAIVPLPEPGFVLQLAVGVAFLLARRGLHPGRVRSAQFTDPVPFCSSRARRRSTRRSA